GVASNTPTATLSGSTGGSYLSYDGTLSTTNKQTLTLGSSSNGDINFIIGGGNNLKINGSIGSTIVSGACVTTTNGIVTGSAACPAGSGVASPFEELAGGIIAPLNSTEDFFIGGQATSSAKFAVLNVSGGTPTASISAGTGTSGAAYFTAQGALQTTNKQSLTLGGGNTGNIVLSGAGTGIIHSNAAGVLSSSLVNLNNATDVSGILPV